MNRLMQRFLWMVLRSLWSPRKKQKVKMQISRHTRDSRMPTHVMTSRSTSCMLSVFCKKSENEVERLKKKRHPLTCLHTGVPCDFVLQESHMNQILEKWNPLTDTPLASLLSPSLTDVSLAVCRWTFRAAALRCIAQVCRLYPSVSCRLAGRAMFNITLLWWIYCSKPHTACTEGSQTPQLWPWPLWM